jgi:hypothetical protein
MRVFTLLILAFGSLHAAEAPLPVPSNLKPDGLPQIPRTLFERVNRYNESRSAVLLDWGPAQREILISTRFGDVPQLHRVNMPGGDRRQLTFFPDRMGEGLFNPTNADEISFTKDTGGGEFYQLYLDDLHSGKITLLTDGSRSRNTSAVWSHDGKHIAYSSTARDGQNADIWVVDPHDPKSARILVQTTEPGWAVSDWSQDGNQLLLTLDRSAVVSELYLLDVASGQKTKLGPDSRDSGWFQPSSPMTEKARTSSRMPEPTSGNLLTWTSALRSLLPSDRIYIGTLMTSMCRVKAASLAISSMKTVTASCTFSTPSPAKTSRCQACRKASSAVFTGV